MQILAAAADSHDNIVLHGATGHALLLARAHIESCQDIPKRVAQGEADWNSPARISIRMASGHEWRFTGHERTLTAITKAVQYGKVQDAD